MLNFQKFQIDLLLNQLNEHILQYEGDFIDVLKRLDNPIAKDLLSIMGKDNLNTDINYVDINPENKSGVRYRNDSKISKKMKDAGIDDKSINTDDDWRSDYKTDVPIVPGKVGKTAQKLLTLVGKTYTASDIEKFTSEYTAKRSAQNINFKELKGDDILDGYNSINYVDGYGTELHQSCMVNKWKDVKGILDLYTENPNQVSLLVCYDETGKIVGRSLLWKTNKGLIMDKIYSAKGDVYQQFVDYANEKNIPYRYIQNNGSDANRWKFKLKGKEIVMDDLFVKLEHSDFKYYPYVDTFSFIQDRNDIAKNSYWGLKNYIECSDTYGGYLTMSDNVYGSKYIDDRGVVKDGKCVMTEFDGDEGIFIWGNDDNNQNIIALIDENNNIVAPRYSYDDNDFITYRGNSYNIEEGQKYKGEEKFKCLIKDLYYNGTAVTLTENEIPDTLESLTIESNTVKEITYLPPTLTSLEITGSNVIEKLADLPDSLKHFTIKNCNLETISASNLKDLSLFQPKKIPNIVCNLKSLTISYGNIDVISNLPDSITNIRLSNCTINRIEKLPKSTNDIMIYNCNRNVDNSLIIDSLPKKLTYLNMSNSNIKTLPKLEKMERIDAYSSKIESLTNVPETLEYADFRDTNMPASIRKEFGEYDTDINILRKFYEKKEEKPKKLKKIKSFDEVKKIKKKKKD